MEVVEAEEVGSLLDEVQQSVLDPQRFCRTVKLKGFQPFTTAENALENVNAISEQIVTDDLKVSMFLVVWWSTSQDHRFVDEV